MVAKKTSRKDTIAGMIFMFVLGAIFMLIGYFFISSYVKLKSECTASTSGLIIEIVETYNVGEHEQRQSNIKRTIDYTPKVRYTVDGKEFETLRDYGSGDNDFTVWQEVTVLYNPDNPRRMLIEEDKRPMLFLYLFTGVGAFFVIIGFVIPFQDAKKRKNEQASAE